MPVLVSQGALPLPRSNRATDWDFRTELSVCDFSFGGCYIMDDLWPTMAHCCEITLNRVRKRLSPNSSGGIWTLFTRPLCEL